MRNGASASDSANVAIATGPLEALLEETAEPFVSEVTEFEPEDEDFLQHDLLKSNYNSGFEYAYVVFPISHPDRTQALSQRMLRFVHNFRDRIELHNIKKGKNHKLEPNHPKPNTCPDERPTNRDESNMIAPTRKTTELTKDARTPMFRFARRDRITQEGSIDGAFVTSDHTGTHAILDTGASRCIIGEKILEAVKALLPVCVQNKLKKTKSQVKFRFGNNQFLTSEYGIHFPLQREESKPLWLAVEVVPGATPFLFSKRAFKALGGILNTTNDTCVLQNMSQHEIPLTIGPTDLYLIDVATLCQPCPEQEISFYKKDHHAYVGEIFHQGEFDVKKGIVKDIGHKIPKDNVVSAGNPASKETLSAAESSTKSCDRDQSLIKVGFSRHAGLRRFVEDCHTTDTSELNGPKFSMDLGRRRGRSSHVGSRSRVFGPEPGRSFGTQDANTAGSCCHKLTTESSCGPTINHHGDRGGIVNTSRMGTESHFMGQEVSRQDICPYDGSRSGVSGLVRFNSLNPEMQDFVCFGQVYSARNR